MAAMRSIWLKVPLSLIALIILFSCASTSVSIQRYVGDLPASAKAAGGYTSFWEALKALEFETADRMGLSSDERESARTLRTMMDGDQQSAANALERLVSATEDRAVRAFAVEVLAGLYLSQH